MEPIFDKFDATKIRRLPDGHQYILHFSQPCSHAFCSLPPFSVVEEKEGLSRKRQRRQRTDPGNEVAIFFFREETSDAPDSDVPSNAMLNLCNEFF